MKTTKVEQYAFIRMNEEGFEEKLNETIRTLSDLKPEVSFTDSMARIKYIEEIEVEEPAPKEIGCKFTCGDCPNLQPILNRKGLPDGRIKYGDCPYSELGRAWKSNEACDILYTMIKNGDIVLMKRDEEEREVSK